MIHSYDDIINHPYNGTKRKNKLSKIMRAAQFAPFAALVGHEDAIKETARIVNDKIELDNDEKLKISDILNRIDYHEDYLITYFIKDLHKSGGVYQTIKTKIKKIDEYNHQLILYDNTKININNIYNIKKGA